jgi:hypothetical protein
VRLLNINGKDYTMKQASELPNAASYAAIVKRCSTWKGVSDHDIVFLPMVSKSGAGRRGSDRTPFNNGKFKSGGMGL